MRRGLRTEIYRITFIALVTLILGFFTQQLIACILVAGTLYAAWLLLQIRHFYQWLENSDDNKLPDTNGIWGDIFDAIYRVRQKNINSHHQLSKQLQRSVDIMDSMRDGVVIVNEDGGIDSFNKSAAHLLDLNSNTDLGQPVLSLIRDPRFVKFFERGDYDDDINIPSPRKIGLTLSFQVSEFGKRERIVLVRDITRLKNLEQMRRDFVANVSHELRTPLTVLTGYLETLYDYKDTIDQRWHKPLEQMQHHATRLENIVNDLMMLARLENEEPSTDTLAVDIGPILARIGDSAVALGKDKGVEVFCEGDESLALNGSLKELESAFSNLVYNAVKYGNNTQAKVWIRWGLDAQGGFVSVKDNGVGIDPVHIPRLTERFYRVDTSHSRETGGTGLGLAIVKHILMRHDSELSIQSELGKGSTFTCRFPFERTSHDTSSVATSD